MKLPSIQECEGLFARYKVPDNFLWHCQKVAQVGTFLAVELKKKGVPIDVELTECACLLHDLFKFVTLDELKADKKFKAKNPTKQQLASWKALKEKYKGMHEREIVYAELHPHYPELAILLRDASHHRRVVEKAQERTWEEKIQHYADARVLGDQVVLLPERLKDGFERYKEDILKFGVHNFEKEKKVLEEDEKEIFSLIGVSPEILLNFNQDVHKVTVDAYDTFTEEYYEGTKNYKDHHFYLKDASIKKGDLLLDVCCAFGRDVALLKEKLIKVLVVDLSQKMIAKAKSLHPDIEFHVMDMRKLHFPKEHFDHIICNAALLHLKKEEIPSVLRSFFMMLKQGGKLWVGVKEGKGEHFEMRKTSLKFAAFFSPEEIKELMKKAGFVLLHFYENIEQRKDERITWLDLIVQKPLKRKQVRE